LHTGDLLKEFVYTVCHEDDLTSGWQVNCIELKDGDGAEIVVSGGPASSDAHHASAGVVRFSELAVLDKLLGVPELCS
jgi:hypothetical protein